MDGSTSPSAALYRKYRPRRFDELVGQPHIVAALTSSIESGRVGHAYLLVGTRGTGKTTTARILAMALNCTDPDGVEPCGRCDSCRGILAGHSLDVVELDAASNNGVDSVRELVANASLGTPGSKKVYIVDEVHMLSTAASNALLKTLEEPPSHVVFVLATTDPQKVLPTVRSRTQTLEFRTVRPEAMSAHLAAVAEREGLELPESAIAEAVRRGRGSVRDALSALDVIAASGEVGDGGRPHALVEAVVACDVEAVFRSVAEAVADGIEPRALAEECVAQLRDMFLVQMGTPELVGFPDLESLSALANDAGPAATVKALNAFGDAIAAMAAGHDGRVNLEVCLARFCHTAKRS